MARPVPVTFHVRPPNVGKDISQPPQTIDTKASPDLLNVRFKHGQVYTRDGFHGKYFGAQTPVYAIDVLYAADGTLQSLSLFGMTEVYEKKDTDVTMMPIPILMRSSASGDTNTNTIVDTLSGWGTGLSILNVCIGSLIWDDAGDIPANTVVTGVDETNGEITISQAATGSSSTTIHFGARIPLATTESDYYTIDIGEGTFDPQVINGGTDFPGSGFADILIFTNAVDGVFAMFIGETSPHSGLTVCEQIYDSASVGLSGARAVAVFDNRLLVGGTVDNPAEVLWSASTDFHDFSSAGSGSLLLGEGPDWIQTIKRMGEFIIFYKERSIYIGRKSGLVDPAISFDPAPGQGIGLAAPMSVGDLGEEHIFLGWDNLYIFSMNELSPIGDTIRDELFGNVGDNGIEPQYINRCIGTIVEEYNEYWLFVPTGKFPTATNVMSRPCMDFIKIVNADFTNSDATVTNIDQGDDITLIRIGDTITHSSITGGEATILGTPGTSSTVSTNTIEMSEEASSTDADQSPYIGNDDGWTVTADGDGTLTTQTGGNLGGIYQDLDFSTGTHVTITSGLVDIGTTGQQTISMLLWLAAPDGDVAVILTANEYTAGDVDLSEPHQIGITVEENSSFSPYAFTFTCVDATCRKLQIVIQKGTSDSTLSIDGIQVVDISGIDTEYLYTHQTHSVPAMLSAGDTPVMIPFFINGIGPWIPDTVYCFNYNTNSWGIWRLPTLGFGYDTVTSTSTIADLSGTVEEITWRFDDKTLQALAPTNLLSGLDGQIYEVSSAYSQDWEGFAGYSILSYWQSKDFDMGRPDMDKTYSRLVIYHEVSHAAVEITVGISTDSGMTWTDQLVDIRQGYTETYADFFVTGSQGRFKVSAASSGIRISGFALKVIPRGEAHAY